jgi:hypothetical protein
MVRVCIIYPCRASHKCFHYPCWDPDCFCPDGITGKSIIRCTMASMGPKTTSGPCHRDRHLAASEYLPGLILLDDSSGASSGPDEAWDARGWSVVARRGGFGLHQVVITGHTQGGACRRQRYSRAATSLRCQQEWAQGEPLHPFRSRFSCNFR